MPELSNAFHITEAGLIPSDWESVNIGEVCDMPTQSISIEKFAQEDYVGTENMLPNCRGISPYIGNLEYSRVREYKVNDILLSNIRPYLKKIWYSDRNAGCSTDVLVFRASKPDQASSNYIFYQLSTDRFFQYVMDGAIGTKMPRGDKFRIKDYCIGVPKDIDEQHLITKVINDLSKHIDSFDAIITKKSLIKTGAMQQLLSGKTRLEGFEKEWIDIELQEIGKLTGAGVDKTINEDEKPVRLLNFLDVYNRDRIFPHELKMWVTASDYKIQRCDVKCGDIFLTPSSELPNDIGRSAVAMADINDACYSYHILRLRPTINLDLNYSAYMLKTEQFEEQVRFLSEGSGKRYVISLKNFREMRVTIPSDLKEQEAIGKVICSMDNEITALKAERDKYIQLKQGMMQKLLTGQIRLPKSCLKQE